MATAEGMGFLANLFSFFWTSSLVVSCWSGVSTSTGFFFMGAEGAVLTDFSSFFLISTSAGFGLTLEAAFSLRFFLSGVSVGVALDSSGFFLEDACFVLGAGGTS